MKKFVILLISIFIFVGISFFVFNAYNTGLNPYSISGSTDAERIGQEAVAKKDASLCGKITMPKIVLMQTNTEDGLKAECYQIAAVGLKDAAICDRNQYDSGKNYCYHLYATTLNDENYCKKDTEFSNKCFEIISQKKNNINICENISENNDREICHAHFAKYSKDVEICKTKIKNIENKDICYRVVASAKKDISLCQEITGQKLKDECTTMIGDYLRRSNNIAN